MTEAAEQFPDLINECHDVVQQIGLDGTILRVNHAWRETLGYDEADLRSLNVFDVIQPECFDY